MDLRAKYLSETCSDPIEYLRQLRQTTEPIGGGTEYCEDGELVEYDVAIEAVRKANDAFIEKAKKWMLTHTYMFQSMEEIDLYIEMFIKEMKGE